MRKTPGQIAYEAAAAATGCKQPWAEANQAKWEAAGAAVANECADICNLLQLCGDEPNLDWDSGTLDCVIAIEAWVEVPNASYATFDQ